MFDYFIPRNSRFSGERRLPVSWSDPPGIHTCPHSAPPTYCSRCTGGWLHPAPSYMAVHWPPLPPSAAIYTPLSWSSRFWRGKWQLCWRWPQWLCRWRRYPGGWSPCTATPPSPPPSDAGASGCESWLTCLGSPLWWQRSLRCDWSIRPHPDVTTPCGSPCWWWRRGRSGGFCPPQTLPDSCWGESQTLVILGDDLKSKKSSIKYRISVETLHAILENGFKFIHQAGQI